jgi:hypothetical protein
MPPTWPTSESCRSPFSFERHALRALDAIHLASFVYSLQSSPDDVEFSSFDDAWSAQPAGCGKRPPAPRSACPSTDARVR